MDPKETYRERIETTLREWKTKIDQLKTQVEKAGAGAKLKYEEYIPTLHAKREEAERKLEELKAASEETWENVKAGVEYAWSELGRVAESAISKFRSEASMSREEQIRLIAYQLWEDERRPEGRHLDHWFRAESIWREQQSAEHSDEPGPPRKRTRKRKEVGTKPTGRRVRQKKPGPRSKDS